MTVLQSNPRVRCTLRATKGLFSDTPYQQVTGRGSFAASEAGTVDSAIVSKPAMVLPI